MGTHALPNVYTLAHDITITYIYLLENPLAALLYLLLIFPLLCFPIFSKIQFVVEGMIFYHSYVCICHYRNFTIVNSVSGPPGPPPVLPPVVSFTLASLM